MATLATLTSVGNAYIWTGGVGVNTTDVVIQTSDVSRFDSFFLFSTAGAMEVFVSLDGVNYTTAPLSLVDMGATSAAPVTVTAANRMYAFYGAFRNVQIQQNGATAVTDACLSMTKKGAQF